MSYWFRNRIPIAKYNENHDELGRFATGDGSGGSDGNHSNDPDEGSKLYAKDDKELSKASILSQLSEKEQADISGVEQGLSGFVSTADLHSKDGEWTAERTELHQRLLQKVFSPESIKAATPAKGESPTLLMLGGRGGSGKSAFTDGTINEFDANKFIQLNNDHFKEALPEYTGKNAAALHLESKHLANQVQTIATKLGVNLLIDGTLRNADDEIDLAKHLKSKGYKIEGHYMYLPREKAAVRAAKRSLGPTGRYVPLDIILSNTKNEENFSKLAKVADHWSIYSNDVPKGTKPKLVARKKS